jgi:uncharacterized protein (TIGR02118 family)
MILASEAPPVAPAEVYGAYRVEERCLKEGAGRVFLVAPIVRAAALSPEALDAHWRDVHGPLALQHHVGMCEYRQLVVLERLSPDAPAFDGLSLLGFPDEDALARRMFDSEEGARALGRDVRCFLDGARGELAAMREL